MSCIKAHDCAARATQHAALVGKLASLTNLKAGVMLVFFAMARTVLRTPSVRRPSLLKPLPCPLL